MYVVGGSQCRDMIAQGEKTMAEYIDKAKLYYTIAERENDYRSSLLKEKNYQTAVALQLQGLVNATTLIKHIVADYPSADVKPVVYGEWIDTPDNASVICSYCGSDWDAFDNDVHRFAFCPACGANMRGKTDEES